jgi:hypothetical protein
MARAFSTVPAEPGTNHNQWIDGFQVINNTFVDNYDGGLGIGPTLDTGFTTLTSGEWTDNLILNTFNGALVKGAGVKRPANSTVERFQAQINDLDYDLFYNVGIDYLGVNGGGTFLLNGANYNTLPAGQRNITGVSLSQPSYSTPLASGQSLAFTVNSPGVDETLSWGGGSPVQLVFGHGTATSATNVTSYGVSGLYSGTLIDASQSWTTSGTAYNTTPAGDWIEITGGTGAGQIRMIVANTATQLTVTPSWTVVPDSTSTYSIFKPEVTLTDNSGVVQGVTMTNGGSGYTSAPAVPLTGGGGSGAAGTAIIANGEVVGVTITSGGSGYTSAPTLTFSGGGGFGASAQPNLGTVQAGIDIRSLPASSEADSSIMLAFHDVNGNPLLANPVNGSSAADFELQAGSAAIAAATSTDAPATDYFGTPRPPGGNDIGFDQYVGQPTINLALSPASLPAATVGIGYSQTVTASGGTAPYTYAVAAGSLPAGLSLSTSGVLSGTPTAGGAFNFTISANDSSGNTGNQSYSFTVKSATIIISPKILSSAKVGASYSNTLTASGGTAPDTFAVAAGSLPAGLSLSTSGVLSGTPTAGGSFNFTITATDSSTGTGPYTGTRSYAFTVGAATISVTPGTLTAGTAGVSYSRTINASGGTAPYTFTISASSLPPGLTLSSGGLLSGMPTTAGSFAFTVTATAAVPAPGLTAAAGITRLSLTLGSPQPLFRPPRRGLAIARRSPPPAVRLRTPSR